MFVGKGREDPLLPDIYFLLDTYFVVAYTH
jgi:hypothetical protein